MKKMVDDKIVDMTPTEIARRQAEDDAFVQRQAAERDAPPPRDALAEIDALKARIAALETRVQP